MIQTTPRIIILVLLILVSFHSFAQEQESIDIPKIGLGMHVEQFKLMDDILGTYTMGPSMNFVASYSPSNQFRIEPEVGFNYHNDKEYDISDRSINVGLGGYRMIQKGKTNIYTGLKLEYLSFQKEWISGSTFIGNLIETNKYYRYGVGPVIGAEFFFGQHFSFGGNLHIGYYELKQTDGDDTYGFQHESVIVTNSGLVMRFYF